MHNLIQISLELFKFIILASPLIIGLLCNMIIFPALFKFRIVPRIEKRLGKKLSYLPSWDVGSLWVAGLFLGKYLEIAMGIVNMYMAVKMQKNPDTIKLGSNMALAKANYDIRQATREEIIMSFIALSTLLYTCLGVCILVMIHKYKHQGHLVI